MNREDRLAAPRSMRPSADSGQHPGMDDTKDPCIGLSVPSARQPTSRSTDCLCAPNKPICPNDSTLDLELHLDAAIG